MIKLTDYEDVAGPAAIRRIKKKAKVLEGKHVVHINSTYEGGGVAEILDSLIPLLNDLGINAGWRIFHGTTGFFNVTKKIHNSLQGEKTKLNIDEKRLYIDTNKKFSTFTHIDHDCVFVHDPQPLPLITHYKKKQPWVWRCHIDLSDAYKSTWNLVLPFINKYDYIISSKESYLKKGLKISHNIIYPAIDPLSQKNMELKKSELRKIIHKYKIPTDKPIIGQISRFDKWKDPSGVIDVFEEVKKDVDCRLVLCGSMASDDPEGAKIYDQVRKKAEKHVKNNDIIFITVENDILVNALQRIFDVCIQKSIREGFGLTVAESLWKGTPVVSSKRGGITLQIKEGINGYLLEPHDTKGFSEKIKYLLKNPEKAKMMGLKGRDIIKENFLITRLLEDHIDFMKEIIK